MSRSDKVSFTLCFHTEEQNVKWLIQACLCPQVTPVPCRETFYIRAKCSSPTTGSVSTPKSLAETPRCASDKCQLKGGIIWPNMVMFSQLQISIPMLSVTFIKKTKTALLVPNALVIETTSYQVRGLLR